VLVAAFDPGPFATGWVLLEAQHGILTCVQYGHINNEATDWGSLLRWASPSLVGVERMAYQGMRSGGYVLETARWGGIIAGYARCLGLQLVEHTAGQWRKQLTGKHNASDDLIWDRVRVGVANMPVKITKKMRSHIADAAGLAMVVYTNHVTLRGGQPTPVQAVQQPLPSK